VASHLSDLLFEELQKISIDAGLTSPLRLFPRFFLPVASLNAKNIPSVDSLEGYAPS
jgi:hypothetical protein